MKRFTFKIIDMFRKIIFALTLSVCIMDFCAQSLKADEPAKYVDETHTGKAAEKGKVSLAEEETELCYEIRRYPKFYGDDNTVHGNTLPLNLWMFPFEIF